MSDRGDFSIEIYIFTYLVDPPTYSTIINRQESAESNLEISPRNQTTPRTTKKDEFQKLIEQRFPSKFVICLAVFIITISIILLSLQIAMYQTDYKFKNQALGIWVSIPLLTTAITSLILSK